jgi:hypothetical protein
MSWQWQQPISKEIFEKKYNLHHEDGIEAVLRGVAKEIASVEKPEKRAEVEELFYAQLIEGKLIPAGRILANARVNSEMKNYNNCFTIDIEDSMEGIYESLKEDAMISKMGGGVGFDISRLRPRGDVLSGGGESSGVISFLRIFDQSAKTIVTGGQRRSAHIALLEVSHPDIEEFITIKRGDENKELTQFNISVKISDAFMKAVEEDADWNLVFGGKGYKTLRARALYDLLARNAFIHNEPGIFNQDTVERYNNGYWAFKMDRVNPCGELVMPPYSLCCLSAVNLTRLSSIPSGRIPASTGRPSKPPWRRPSGFSTMSWMPPSIPWIKSRTSADSGAVSAWASPAWGTCCACSKYPTDLPMPWSGRRKSPGPSGMPAMAPRRTWRWRRGPFPPLKRINSWPPGLSPSCPKGSGRKSAARGFGTSR